MGDAPTSTEAPEPASSFGFGVTMAILATLLVSTLGVQLLHVPASGWGRNAREAYRTIWPQDWSFFADTPDLPSLTIFRLNSDMSETEPLIVRQISAEDAWGLGGVAKARAREAGYLIQSIPDASWHACGGPATKTCLSGATPLSITNRVRPASVCGMVALVLTSPQTSSSVKPDAKVAVTVVRCPS